MKRVIVGTAILFGLLSALFGQEIYYEEDIDSQEAYSMQKKGALVIDVRTPGEFLYAGHPVGAVNIPIFFYHYKPKKIDSRIALAKYELKKGRAFDAHKTYDIVPQENEEFLNSVKKAVKSFKPTAIVVICRSGARSRYAANLLAKNGYKNVYNVEDGFIFGWKKSGLPWGEE